MHAGKVQAAPVAYLCCCCFARMTQLAPTPAQQRHQQAWHTLVLWSLEQLVLMPTHPAQHGTKQHCADNICRRTESLAAMVF